VSAGREWYDSVYGGFADDLNAEINRHNAGAELARARALYLRKFRDYFWTD